MALEANADSGQPSGDAGNAPSLSDAISAALSASKSADDVKAPEPETPEVKEPDAGVEKAGDKRDGEDANAAKDDAKGKVEDAAPKDKGDAPTTFEAPKHWPEADRKAFAALAPDAQAIIKRLSKDLEGGFTRKSQELGDKAKYADAVRGLIDEPTRQQMANSGVSEYQYFAYLNQLNQFSARQPVEYVKWAMQNLGVKPEHIVPAHPQPAQQQPSQPDLNDLLADPNVKRLEAELNTLKGQWTQRQQAEEFARQQQLGQHRQSLQSVALSFRGAQDDAGQLLYPHFDSVHRHMGALMETDPQLASMPDSAEKMKAAYDMAVWARPDLRQGLVEAETSRRMAAAEKAREVARAKSITAIKPASGVSTTPARPQSLDEIIRGQMSKHGM
jgi:hypothetical protein